MLTNVSYLYDFLKKNKLVELKKINLLFFLEFYENTPNKILLWNNKLY